MEPKKKGWIYSNTSLKDILHTQCLHGKFFKVSIEEPHKINSFTHMV